MSKYQEKLDACDVEIARLKSLVPGLHCSDKIMSDRGMPLVLVGYLDDTWPLFYLESQEGPQDLANRLLEAHVDLTNRLQENIKALKEIVNE